MILLKDAHDCKRFAITLDIGYMDSRGISINIMYVINLRFQIYNCKRNLEMSPSAS